MNISLSSTWKWILLSLLALGLILFVLYRLIDKAIPQGQSGKAAEELALAIQEACGKEAWDSLGVVYWHFPPGHKHLWDKNRHWAQVEWKDYRALIALDDQKGLAFQNDKLLEGKEKDQALKKAFQFWANDSFWIAAPFKLFDGGTERSLVELEDGEKALLIHYGSGGVTPGDHYLWKVDENMLPKAWQLWVSILPVGGLETTWDDWVTLPGGAKIATSHAIFGKSRIQLDTLAAAHHWQSWSEQDPFQELADWVD